ncbi:MAG: uroporphyrinogen decarboxylase family protein [Bacillota bacterium]
MLGIDNWDQLSPKEKMDIRFDRLSNADFEFPDQTTEEAYKERVQMLKDVIQLKKPVRVPQCLNLGFFVADYAGYTAKDMMYDYDKLAEAYKKFHNDFEIDAAASSMLMGPAKVFDILDYKLYDWPGNGVDEKRSYQCIEKEYMKAEEYDLLINDPSGYWMRFYLPRVIGAMESWGKLSPWTDIIELPFMGPSFIPFGLPDVQESLKKILEAGSAALEWAGAFSQIDAEVSAKEGLPPLFGGFAKAPFDTLGDTMRGTRPIMLDMFRRPEKLLEALEVLTPINIEMGIRSANQNNNPIIFIPLHKGADGFMSEEQFAKFYWPTLEKVVKGLADEGIVPFLFVEGGYNDRLDFLAREADLPDKQSIWIFDDTDMRAAKEALGDKACIGGNVPGSLLQTGSPEEVEDYVKDLIENVGADGGYILSNGVVLDDAQPENVTAMLEAGRKYGKY